jgi:V/A-type H+-transporting ATPase subunit D
MAVTFQFNKISMQAIQKELKARETALPTLKSKEAALRTIVKRKKETLQRLVTEYEIQLSELRKDIRLWSEFQRQLVTLKKLHIRQVKIAGTPVPEIERIEWNVQEYSRFSSPAWYTAGIGQLQELTRLLAKVECAKKEIEILESARRKTTQKVNLYERVQIPGYTEALRKIGRYLEDVENLDKSAQKITKSRM